MVRRNDTVCPICANESPQLSKDDGDSWQCELCMGVFDDESGERLA